MYHTPTSLRRVLQSLEHILVQKCKTRKYNTTKLKVIGSLVGISGVTVASIAPISKSEEITAAFGGGVRFLR